MDTPERCNTASGKPREAPNIKESGTSLVAKVMRREEAKPAPSGGPMKFTIGENMAKKINQDAAPK
jgi:hypothetical protein